MAVEIIIFLIIIASAVSILIKSFKNKACCCDDCSKCTKGCGSK